MIRDLIGKKFERLIVIKYIGTNKYRQSLWLCLCDCGHKIIVNNSALNSGNTRSCGCLRIKHGHSYSKKHKESRTYNSWKSMIGRCNNPNNLAYKNYGKRKIMVCNRWNPKNGGSFKNFLEDMGERPKNTTLNKINNNLSYYKKNCNWITIFQQNRNKRNNRFYFYNNKKQLLVDWAKEYNINYNTLKTRIYSGMSIKEALTIPIKKRKSIAN